MLILLAFKMALPQHFCLSRGNHEAGDFTMHYDALLSQDERMNEYYGFAGEVLAKPLGCDCPQKLDRCPRYNAELPPLIAFQRVFMSLALEGAQVDL